VDALLGTDTAARERAQTDLSAEIRQVLAPYRLRRAGIVLTFGVSPDPFEGNDVAKQVNGLLLKEFPALFGAAILREYHVIDPARSHRGNVELEIYFLMEKP
jgi:hypothetical protein